MLGETVYRESVVSGYRRMAQSTVVICALARDCAPALSRNLPWLDALSSHFKRADTVIFENDSKDGSKSLLAAWASGRRRTTIFLEDFGTDTTPARNATNFHPSYSRSRIQKMARYRNKYLEFASRLDGVEYLIVIDLDVHYIDTDGIAHAFGQNIPWDAQFANGRIMDAWRQNLGEFYWDTYAMWEVGDTSPQTEAKLSAYWEMLQPLSKGMPLFAVQSAFGGMGLYRWKAIAGHRYGVENNHNDPNIEVICEHAYLHRQMIAAGYFRLFINPSMIVYYDKGPRSRTSLWAERLSHAVRQDGVIGFARKLVRKMKLHHDTAP